MAKGASENGASESASAKQRKPTMYVVLRRVVGTITWPNGPGRDTESDGGFEVWEPMRNEEAKNDVEACKQASMAIARAAGADEGIYDEGDWRAVPLTSWHGGVRLKNRTVVLPDITPLDSPKSIDDRAAAAVS